MSKKTEATTSNSTDAKAAKASKKAKQHRFVWATSPRRRIITLIASRHERMATGMAHTTVPGKRIEVANGVYITDDQEIIDLLLAHPGYREPGTTAEDWTGPAADPSKAFTLVSDAQADIQDAMLLAAEKHGKETVAEVAKTINEVAASKGIEEAISTL